MTLNVWRRLHGANTHTSTKFSFLFFCFFERKQKGLCQRMDVDYVTLHFKYIFCIYTYIYMALHALQCDDNAINKKKYGQGAQGLGRESGGETAQRYGTFSIYLSIHLLTRQHAGAQPAVITKISLRNHQ